MRKRATKKSAADAFLASPPPPPSAAAEPVTRSSALSPENSPSVQFDFDLDGLAGIASALKKKKRNTISKASASSGSKRMKPTGFSPPPPSMKSVNSISDLKDLSSSNLDSIKRQLERSHSEILKDAEASQNRLQKRFKIQTQACQNVMDEAEKDYKKISEQINEAKEAMKASYAEFIAEAQTTASRLFKTSFPELAKTTEKGIASLQSRFGVSSTAI